MILLAAGQAKRFGGGKLLAEFQGQPLWERAAETAKAIDFCKRVVVVGPDSPIESRLGWIRVENQFAENGMGTSITVGVRALTDCDRVIIMLADMPLVSRTHLERLIAAQGVAFTRYPDGSAGCPAILPRSAFRQLEGLTGEQGARSLEFGEAELVAPLDWRELADVDTVRDLEKLTSEPYKKAHGPTLVG
ncbi:nucleotidyltransferase family protein [Qipengyuania sp. XHP0207]|uniref:nucleotidyltransferase family protein n=1 Tax=Qipengyuania sp. XHP0207 TaxID=3038078 RepID=UPI00241FD544|nr:nucleotidyltransferase family protein [Qipengyuania sp. XHP0207]MDG5748934.1 nucleotidyltransferase family protein [Qipengyuania sp. XHP0207]